MITIIPPYPLDHPTRPLCKSLLVPGPTCTLGKDPFPWSTRLNTATAIPTYPLGRDCMHYEHSLGLQEAWNVCTGYKRDLCIHFLVGCSLLFSDLLCNVFVPLDQPLYM